MSDLSAWNAVTQAAYEHYLERTLNNPIFAQWQRDHEAWWAQQTRWFKIRYRIRSRARRLWSEIRRRIAARVYPEGQYE